MLALKPLYNRLHFINVLLEHETAVHILLEEAADTTGALIWLAPIWLAWAQIAQPTSNHLKSPISLTLKTPGVNPIPLGSANYEGAFTPG